MINKDQNIGKSIDDFTKDHKQATSLLDLKDKSHIFVKRGDVLIEMSDISGYIHVGIPYEVNGQTYSGIFKINSGGQMTQFTNKKVTEDTHHLMEPKTYNTINVMGPNTIVNMIVEQREVIKGNVYIKK